MKFNLVNDDKLQIIISKEDMAQRDMKKWDLVPHNPEAQKLFQEILEEAKEDCGFEVGTDAQLMIEAFPMTGESMLITVTKMNGKKNPNGKPGINLDLEGLGQSLLEDIMEEEMLPDVQTEDIIYRMEELEDAISASHMIAEQYTGASQLYRYKEKYYLAFLEKDLLNQSGMDHVSEYGDEIHTVIDFFREHSQLVIKEHAVETLSKI